ncbi:MAG: terpene cyclase/mutase family protein, partial [Anaerolineae bacterium]|nr:terpene cyclase/mutase family protein [Anaerolineae bacterium]
AALWARGRGAATAWILVSMTLVAAGAEDAEKSAARLVTPTADRAIERGLSFLAARQREDGSLGSGSYRGNVAVVSLGGMAWMAGGSTPGRGRYGKQVALALDYVLANVQESGYFNQPAFEHHGPMYGHGFATLFVAECYGMTSRPGLREKLAKAVKLMVASQNEEGGWRYYPQRMDADISVTVCQMMALRAARNAGVFVPPETMDRATAYVKKSQNPDGGFMYQLSQGGESAFPRSAAAVVGLLCAGVYEGPEVAKGMAYLAAFRPQPGVARRETYYFYGHYYAALAFWQVGGEPWLRWYPAIREELIGRQRSDGSWIDPISPEFATAMACLILQTPNNCLPIFQR